MVVKQKLRGLQAASKAKKQTKQLELQVVALGGRVAELEQAAAAQGERERRREAAAAQVATDLLKGKEREWERLAIEYCCSEVGRKSEGNRGSEECTGRTM